MSRSGIIFDDPLPDARALLGALLGSTTEASAAGVTVGVRPLPGDDASRPLPYVQIVADSPATRDARLNGSAVLRFACYGRDAGAGTALAALCEALLIGASGGRIRAFNPETGPLPAIDPDLDIPVTSFTLTARLRPRAIGRTPA